MQYFIGIVPDESYKQKIIAFHQKWEHHSLLQVVEPHITLKAQGGLTEDRGWLENVRNLCRHFQPFQISMDEPAFFGADILYLSATSNELVELHKRLVKVIAPAAEEIVAYFELDNFVPHLTLGKTAYGLTKQELFDMAAAAEKELSPYPVIDVNFIRIYQEDENHTYRKLVDIPLGV